MKAPRTTKAYSYLRFSSPDQIKGDSFRRQSDLATNYALRNNLYLDELLQYEDRGISAYHGRNAQIGALKQFLEHIEDGIISKGSYLLVESLDRVSRDEILSALTVFLDIIQGGITIVTLLDNRKYNEKIVNANPTELLISLLIMMRAREESEIKSMRLKEMWQNKRSEIRSKILSRTSPLWIKYNEEKERFELIEERASIVKRIFKMAHDRKNPLEIARILNEDNVPSFSGVAFWRRHTIWNLLRNPAVMGIKTLKRSEYENGKRREVNVMKVNGYYPEVVTKIIFTKLNQKLRTKKHIPITNVNNIFGYIAKCPICGSRMSMKGNHMLCIRADHNSCTYNLVNYRILEKALYENIHILCSAESRKIFDKVVAIKKKKLFEIIKAEPLDRKMANTNLRQLFKGVVINYTTGNLEFEWNNGKTTIFKYTD